MEEPWTQKLQKPEIPATMDGLWSKTRNPNFKIQSQRKVKLYPRNESKLMEMESNGVFELKLGNDDEKTVETEKP